MATVTSDDIAALTTELAKWQRRARQMEKIVKAARNWYYVEDGASRAKGSPGEALAIAVSDFEDMIDQLADTDDLSGGCESSYSDACKRIRQLEALNATLAAQVDRQARVVEAALVVARAVRETTDWTVGEAALEYAARVYQEHMAQLVREECCHFQD